MMSGKRHCFSNVLFLWAKHYDTSVPQFPYKNWATPPATKSLHGLITLQARGTTCKLIFRYTVPLNRVSKLHPAIVVCITLIVKIAREKTSFTVSLLFICFILFTDLVKVQ